MNNVVENSKMSPKKPITAKQLAKYNLTKRKNPDWDNLDRGYRYLTLDMKLPHDQAIAVMGNVVEESLGNYKAKLKNGKGQGLIQWDKAPNSRYGLWGSIWASVAKPANVYDASTDTVKNYWAPWGGLKGDKVRLKFMKAPLKLKTLIYAESYLRPGKPRIADRQLSAMLLDSIYNPRIKNILILRQGGKINIIKLFKEGGQIRKMQTASGGPITRYETLPNIEVVGYRPIELKTYKPLHKEYPFTGHSSLDIPIDEDTAYTQGLYSPYGISVDKTSKSKDYNLITNNCANATLGALNYIFGTKEKPYLFTTPGDVRDYAINKLHGKVTRDKDGIDTILIPRNKNNAKEISKRALEWRKNKDDDTIYEFEYKQGGKMNILEFLKNGSGIHIKKENRGKFTSYCGGTVTDECIRRGKNSSSATIRKRATFAANARKWKHKKGGKAFVEGINVLDSNPDAYKYVKKKYKMRSAASGTKIDWGKVNNTMNTIGSVSSSIMNIAKTFKNLEALELMKKASESMLSAFSNKALNEAYEEALKEETSNSLLVNKFNAYHKASNKVASKVALKKQELDLELAQAEQANAAAQNEAWMGAIKNLGGFAMNALNKNGMTQKAANSNDSMFSKNTNIGGTNYKTFNAPTYKTFNDWADANTFKKEETIDSNGFMNTRLGKMDMNGMLLKLNPIKTDLFNYKLNF